MEPKTAETAPAASPSSSIEATYWLMTAACIFALVVLQRSDGFLYMHGLEVPDQPGFVYAATDLAAFTVMACVFYFGMRSVLRNLW